MSQQTHSVECASPSIDELVRAGALFVVNHSGGKDSQAMLIHLLARIPKAQLLVVHASLGDVEWEGAQEHARKQADDAGVQFLVAYAKKTLFEMVEHRFKVRPGPNSPCWPSARNRQCTSDLKRDPITRDVRRYAKAHGIQTIVTCLGIRAGESRSRAKRSTFRRSDTNSVAGRDWYEWLPIHGMSTAEVFAMIAGAGQQPHWAYAAGNERLSCVFCIFGSPRDLANGARHRPELLARYLEVEQRTGYTMHQSQRPLEVLLALGNQQLAPSTPARACASPRNCK